MCTVTFTPTKSGYYLAMNRDERIERRQDSPPDRAFLSGVEVVSPKDVEGGTWIAGNAYGCAFALINWNEPSSPAPKRNSRGKIVPALSAHSSPEDAFEGLSKENLDGVLPFRVIGVFSDDRKISEWTWDQRQLRAIDHPWEMNHWCSSGLSDLKAKQLRSEISKKWQRKSDTGTLPWMRSLHATHEHGNFGFCVHRGDVETLSYSEINWDGRMLKFSHRAGSPCIQDTKVITVELSATQAIG